jgi:hypothetical protein
LLHGTPQNFRATTLQDLGAAGLQMDAHLEVDDNKCHVVTYGLTGAILADALHNLLR